MALTEIEFELTAHQFELMGYPRLAQGQALDVQLETAALLPEPGGDGWYAVQQPPLTPQMIQVGAAVYAFAGQITQADILRSDGEESAVLVVQCGAAPLRVMVVPQADGRLPYGTWETRYLAGTGRLLGTVEEDFSVVVGERVGLTIWGFRRLALRPGDPAFGQWHESVELLPTPLGADRVVVMARLHRTRA
jgi:hypothetical protein